jgi:adenylate cyclase
MTGVKAVDNPLSDSAIPLRQILQTLNHGVALIERDSWRVLFENARFFHWFPPPGDGEDKLDRRVPGFKVERATDRVGRNRPYSLECEVKVGARTIPLTVEVKSLEAEGSPLLVECRDLSKQKEAEYMLASYSNLSEKHARELQREKERVEKLLLNVMPRSVYEEMREFGTSTPQKFESASVLMLDFVNFTEMAISQDPSAMISELNDIFSAFDRIAEMFNCERIKTIGDAYMAVSGVPEQNSDHASNIAKVALRMRRYLDKRNAAHPEQWQCRIGINSGPLIGSIVGVQKYVYDIFGPGVNLAARMEELSEPMHITLCEATHNLIEDDFICSPKGEFDVKGFGSLHLYNLEGEINRGR